MVGGGGAQRVVHPFGVDDRGTKVAKERDSGLCMDPASTLIYE